MSPFGAYRDFADCERQNRQARDPEAYCGSIKHKTEDKMQKHYLDDSHSHPHGKDDYFESTARKAVNSASYLRQSVRAAVEAVVKHKDKAGSTAHHKTGGEGYGALRGRGGDNWKKHTHKPEDPYASQHGPNTHTHGKTGRVDTVMGEVQKGHDPVKEEGKKKLTAKDGVANEGAQDDQPFAVAFGPDNYDKLTKALIAAPYQEAYNAAGTILKALENKQFNFPGNIEEHMKKAHAAIHGREMWDARYGDVCELITRARKILHSIEKTAEVSQGGSGMMVVGKADPGQSEAPKPQPKVPQSKLQTPRQAARTKQKFMRDQWGGPPPGKGLGVRRARKAKPGGPPIAREDYPKIPSGPGYGQRPRPAAKARKAVQKAIKAVRRE